MKKYTKKWWRALRNGEGHFGRNEEEEDNRKVVEKLKEKLE